MSSEIYVVCIHRHLRIEWSTMFFTLVLWTIFFYVVYYWLTMRPKNYPPGPPYVPVLGSSLSLIRKHLHIPMAVEWRQKYGPVVGFLTAAQNIVAVSGPHEILEVLHREEFQARVLHKFIYDRSFGKRLGVFFSDGPFWIEQRRFTLKHLRDFGFGKRSMEEFIMEETEDTIKEITQKETVQVTGLFTIATLNVLWRMIAGARYSRDDAELLILLEKLRLMFRSGNAGGGITGAFPILMKIAPVFSGYSERLATTSHLQDFFRKSIREHKETIDENNARDLIDVYLREIKLQKNNPDSTFTEEGLITICLDLFTAGGETIASSVGFSLLYMVVHPNVQKAVQKELDAVVGRDRRPALADRARLHYAEAVLSELFRISSVAPVTPPHRATKDTTLKGYFIPKDSMIIVNLYSLFRDKEHWGDPEVFRPERFLDANGNYVKDDWMIPFGAGKRVCIGEVLARNTFFLFFTSLLQEFWFSVPEGDPEPTLVPLPGFTIAPAPFRVKAAKRS